MKTLKIFALFAIVAVLAIASTYAFMGGWSNPSQSINREAALNAIESGNYSAWKELHKNSNGRMVRSINESNFFLMQEMHKARLEGNIDKVREIRTKIGFVQGLGKNSNQGKSRGMHNSGSCPFAN